MQTHPTDLPGVLLIEPKAHIDSRGFFLESWQKDRYQELNIPEESWAQDNVSFSHQGVLRGLHFQFPHLQGKLITVLQGKIFDVALDIRVGSPTFGKWTSAILSSENLHQLWVPKGFAHGFLVLSEAALVSYKASDFYHPEEEHSILWNDPEIGIKWPDEVRPSLSSKDKKGRLLKDIPHSLLPTYLK